AIDVAGIHGTEVAAVVGHGAMIAQEEIMARRHHHVGISALVGVKAGYIRFPQAPAVHVHASVIDADVIAGHPYHALDVALGGIAGITKNYDVATFDRL